MVMMRSSGSDRKCCPWGERALKCDYAELSLSYPHALPWRTLCREWVTVMMRSSGRHSWYCPWRGRGLEA